MKRISTVLLFTFLLIQSLSAQRPNSFSYDPSRFIGEFEDFFKTFAKGDNKDAGDEFYANYSAGKYNTQQKMAIIKLTNEMLDNNCQGNPDFVQYVLTCNALVNSGQISKFENWHKTLSTSLKRSRDDFQKFLTVSKNVFADKTLLQVGAFTWVAEASNIDLQVQGDPMFIFKNMTLFCYTPGDTFEIYNTNGRFIPSKNVWMGNGGKMDWTRVGLDSNKVYAQLKNYKIDLTDGLTVADSASFFNKYQFTQSILGRVTDKPMGRSQGDRSTYPQFESYQLAFSGVKYGKADFKGGFGMRGAVVLGRGVGGQKAELWFSYKGKRFLRVASNDFYVRENKITNDKVELTVFLDKDSIYHPQLNFSYLINEDKINLYRDSKLGVAAAPFSDFFHMVEFSVDEMKWKLNEPKIDLKMVAADDAARFSSLNYYREYAYEKIQGILDYNPLMRIKQYCEKNNTNTFHIASYAAAFRSNTSDIKIQMIDMNDLGFVYYNSQTEIVTIKPKLKDFVNAHMGKTDFDAISFKSTISALPNASISLVNNDLIIQGVPKFYFSDSQSVYILPKEQVITLKKNRTIDFNGKLRAGLADFYGNNFSFDYTKFNVRLNNVDSLKFLYRDDTLGYLANVKSVIQNIYGTLEIDHPYNKSGRKKFSKYPVFTSEVGSKVFYDYPTTQKGSYTRNRFHFAVDPFTLDSLADLNLYTLALPGTFLSDGILPDMRQELSMQPDKSLGFFIPNDVSTSYTLYRGKGSAKMSVALSNDGLIGEGTVSYLASRSQSKRLIFLLDSMNANCDVFENDRTSLFPTVIKSANVYNHWIPYQDTMFITNKGEPIKIAYDRARLSGTIILTPLAMKAKGKMDIEDGELLADMFELRPVEILSEDAIFRQRSPKDTTQIAFSTSKVKAYVNLDNKYAEFTYRNPTEINNTFILNNYVGSFEKLKWDMIPRTLEFKGPTEKENPSAASYLLSSRKNQDNLTFKTASVFMTLDDYTMNCKKIPYINIADSRVLPDSGKAVIRENAEMDMLVNAQITADTINTYHKVNQVTIKINGRTDVRGAGNYRYVDKNKNEQKFYLDKILVADKKYLEGSTLIPDSINFLVGPKVGFRGNAILRSFNPNLEYNGFFKAMHASYFPKSDWFKAAAVISPDSVYVNTTGQPLTNLNKQALSSGLYVSNDSTHVYAALFGRKRNTSDAELMKTEGTFAYFENIEEFRLGPYDKVFGTGKRGNFMAFSEPKKLIYNEGRFNLGFDLPKFSVKSAGYSSFNLKDTTFYMKLMMVIDFPIPSQALKLMYDSLNEQGASSPNQFYDEKALKIGIPELIDEKGYKKLGDDMVAELNDKNIESLIKTMLITDATLTWNQASRSFVSVADFGIRSFEKNLLERKVKGRLEIKKLRSGDDFTLYLMGASGSWYFFKYQKGIMGILASDPVFNEMIKANIDKMSSDDYKLRQGSISDRNKLVRALKGKL